MTETKLTTKGQVVIPKAIRERLHWRPGTRLRIEAISVDAIKLELASNGKRRNGAQVIDRAFGFIRSGDPLSELEAEHRWEVARDERRRRRR
jgi:AbrB family looped-hinge helix DNA binding protein